MKNRCNIYTLFLSLFIFFFPQILYSSVIIGGTGLFHQNIKKTSVPQNSNKSKNLSPEKATFWGGGVFVEIPFKPNSFGFVAHASLLYSFHDIYLNKYTIENYEFNLKTKNDEELATFQSGDKIDRNITEDLEQVIRNENLNKRTAVEDYVIYATMMLKYSFPVHIPLKYKVFKYISRGLDIINPWVGGGCANTIVNRSFKGVTYVYKKKLLNIVGVDPSPDPDFYLIYGGGFIFKIPNVRIFGTQIIFTLDYFQNININPEDKDKPYDDRYKYDQKGYTIRFGAGIII